MIFYKIYIKHICRTLLSRLTVQLHLQIIDLSVKSINMRVRTTADKDETNHAADNCWSHDTWKLLFHPHLATVCKFNLTLQQALRTVDFKHTVRLHKEKCQPTIHVLIWQYSNLITFKQIMFPLSLISEVQITSKDRGRKAHRVLRWKENDVME